MGCKHCFNGCAEIVSDKCVKYTGIDVEFLDITKGDSLFVVEEKLIEYLSTVLTAEGILPTINKEGICDLIKNNFPIKEDLTLNDILDVLINSICTIQTQVTTLLANPNLEISEYVINCLTGITDPSNTREVLQATLNKVCQVESNLALTIISFETSYVKVSEINSYIQTYLTTNSNSTSLISSKMIPYVAVEYYGPLNYFNAAGVGEGDWANVYLCNGQNGTPDKRGRVAVGRTDVVGGGTMSDEVNPNILGNPEYTGNTTVGSNSVVLDVSQIPSHTHSNTVTNNGDHTHTYTQEDPSGSGNSNGSEDGISSFPEATTSSNGDHTHTVTINPTGGGEAHSNIQPSLACNYIIHIPA